MWKAFQRADTNMAPKHLKKVKDIDEFNQQEELSKLGEGNYASEVSHDPRRRSCTLELYLY